MCAKRGSVSSFGVPHRNPMHSADLAGTIVHLQRLLDEIYMRDELRKRDQFLYKLCLTSQLKASSSMRFSQSASTSRWWFQGEP